MERYICENVFVPLRSGPSHKTEMLSQVLFGETYTLTDRAGSWIRVHTDFDNYDGWVDGDHLLHSLIGNLPETNVLNRSLPCFRDDGSRLYLEPGCVISDPDFEQKTFTSGGKLFKASPEFSSNHINASESLADTAMRFINSPYIWGGRLPSGIDCSGLTQLVYKIHGISLPRDSWKQAEAGRSVDFISSARPGDLVFFDNDRGRITHVGMILSEGLVIHASGLVRIDRIDHQGIYKPERNGYSHKLRLIRRIVG